MPVVFLICLPGASRLQRHTYSEDNLKCGKSASELGQIPFINSSVKSSA